MTTDLIHRMLREYEPRTVVQGGGGKRLITFILCTVCDVIYLQTFLKQKRKQLRIACSLAWGQLSRHHAYRRPRPRARRGRRPARTRRDRSRAVTTFPGDDCREGECVPATRACVLVTSPTPFQLE